MAVPNRPLWEDYVLTQLAHSPSFLTQGVVAFESGLPLAGGETRRRIPGIKDLETIAGDDDRVTDTDGMTLTPKTADGFVEYAPIIHRGNAIKDTYVKRRANGQNMLATYGPQLAGYNRNQMQRMFGSILKGLFDNTAGVLRVTHRTDARTENLALSHVTNAKAAQSLTSEEAGQKLKLLYVHGLVHADLANAGSVTYADAPAGFEMFTNGSGVIEKLGDAVLVVNNRICASITVGADTFYPSYLCGPDALYVGWQNEMEIDEEAVLLANGKSWVMQWLNSYCLGVVGVSFADVENPTDANLETATNWTKSGRPDHEILIRQILTKIGS